LTNEAGRGDAAVLVLGFRDCRANPRQPPKAVSLLALFDLVAQAAAGTGTPSPLDGGSTFTDFPAGYEATLKA
jgi:hypothetical protein